jgi:phosphoribosylaminoimidazole-succinocarboxamide synthase
MFPLWQTDLPLPLFKRGKVRDSYDLGDKLLIIATDRISAFDVVLPNAIPFKGEVLNRLSAFWFERTSHIIRNHFIAMVEDTKLLEPYFPPGLPPPSYLSGRSMIVRKAQPLPIECVVRGYLFGSGWAEYRLRGEIYGVVLPSGMREGEKLPQPLFTPTTKAPTGHDLPLSKGKMAELIGEELSSQLEGKSLSLYLFAQEYALKRGIIIADTKFEFGLINGELVLIDELLTPDSSRFWDAGQYKVGEAIPSMDKQLVRDWLISTGWNKEPPAPHLPGEIIQETSRRYKEVYHRITSGHECF